MLGASGAVQDEFALCAEVIGRELKFPPGDSDPITNLLFRLKGRGTHVRYSQRPKTSRIGNLKTATNHARVSIYPLRSAVIKYLTQLGGRPQVKPRSAPVRGWGQIVAVKKNREAPVRTLIVRALESLGAASCRSWPDFVVAFSKNMNQQPEYQQPVSPAPFQPPDFDRLTQSPGDWTKIADAAWQEHRAAFLGTCEFWVTAGVDEEIPPASRTRGPRLPAENGRRGDNTVVKRRYVWAAKYLLGFPIKQIAAEDLADPSTVGRIARQILQQANWTKPRKTNKSPRQS